MVMFHAFMVAASGTPAGAPAGAPIGHGEGWEALSFSVEANASATTSIHVRSQVILVASLTPTTAKAHGRWNRKVLFAANAGGTTG